jgi:CHAT domain-containing protein
MKKIIFLILLFFAATLFHFANQNEGDPQFKSWYKAALEIYKSENPTEADELSALQYFDQCIADLSSKNRHDSIQYDCYIKAGSIAIGLDLYDKALTYFNNAIHFGTKNKLIDSLLFPAYLFSGRTYYAKSNYDSAYYQYKKAEQIVDTYKGNVAEKERLYNVLGVIHYDFGNSNEAIRYFTRALYILESSNQDEETNEALLINYKVNILSAYIKLQAYEKADSICNLLLKMQPLTPQVANVLFSKKVAIALATKQPTIALQFIKKISFTDKNTLTINDYYAKIFRLLKRYDEGLFYAQKSIDSNKKFHANPKNLDFANAYHILGNILTDQKKYVRAVEQYQIALTKLLPQFNDTAVAANPQKFLGTFSAITLLEVLQAKAQTLRLLYDENKSMITLKNCVATYRTYFELTQFLDQSYSSDDAKLFLGQQKRILHDEPIQLCLQLYKITNDITYFDEALYFDEENKSTLLNSNRTEREHLLSSNIPDTLINTYEKYKRNITTISLKLSNPMSDSLLNAYQKELNDYEVLLAKTKQRIDDYEGKKIPSTHMNLIEIKNKLTSNQSLLSYHLFNNELITFYIDKKKQHFFKKSVNDSFYQALNLLSDEMRRPNPAIDISSFKQYLHGILLADCEPYMKQKKVITIIPDDDLHQLPFELLENKNGTLLLSQYAINYVYATRYLFAQQSLHTNTNNLLVVAPFTQKGNPYFTVLPYTNNEIKDLKGIVLKDKEATKDNLIKNSIDADILHLATHAKANNNIPSQSFIALYLLPKDSIGQYMYSAEIANLKLNNLKLVYLSACESGTGKLVKGEGLMSLSRSFANAGCNNIITSLWKADDVSTAYITQHFYQYLKKGDNQILALQKAKLDYINDPQIEKRKKQPYYWAHLIHIGQLDNTSSGGYAKKILLGLAALLLLFFVIIKIRKATSQ